MNLSERFETVETRLRLMRRKNPIGLIGVFAAFIFVVLAPLFILAGGQSIVRGVWQALMVSVVVAALTVYATGR